MSRFSINNHKGFNLKFNNDWRVSVQFGPGNYCERRESKYNEPESELHWESSDAEIAVWHARDGKMVYLESDVVRGWCTADEVALVIYKVSTAKSTLTTKQMTKRLSKIWK
tara:strand:+ start:258 stop:590 length:333 start_codon:yes stop_codon:yes gene_type:complete